MCGPSPQGQRPQYGMDYRSLGVMNPAMQNFTNYRQPAGADMGPQQQAPVTPEPEPQVNPVAADQSAPNQQAALASALRAGVGGWGQRSGDRLSTIRQQQAQPMPQPMPSPRNVPMTSAPMQATRTRPETQGRGWSGYYRRNPAAPAVQQPQASQPMAGSGDWLRQQSAAHGARQSNKRY